MTRFTRRMPAVQVVLLAAAALASGCGRIGQNGTADGRSNSEFPVVEGAYQLSDDWSVTLPGRFSRHFEDDSQVLGRPGITIWTIVWNNDQGKSIEDRLASIQAGISPAAYDLVEEKEEGLSRLAYRLKEAAYDRRAPAFYGFVIGKTGHVQLGIYFDDESRTSEAETIWRSLKETPERPQ